MLALSRICSIEASVNGFPQTRLCTVFLVVMYVPLKSQWVIYWFFEYLNVAFVFFLFISSFRREMFIYLSFYFFLMSFLDKHIDKLVFDNDCVDFFISDRLTLTTEKDIFDDSTHSTLVASVDVLDNYGIELGDVCLSLTAYPSVYSIDKYVNYLKRYRPKSILTHKAPKRMSVIMGVDDFSFVFKLGNNFDYISVFEKNLYGGWIDAFSSIISDGALKAAGDMEKFLSFASLDMIDFANGVFSKEYNPFSRDFITEEYYIAEKLFFDAVAWRIIEKDLDDTLVTFKSDMDFIRECKDFESALKFIPIINHYENMYDCACKTRSELEKYLN